MNLKNKKIFISLLLIAFIILTGCSAYISSTPTTQMPQQSCTATINESVRPFSIAIIPDTQQEVVVDSAIKNKHFLNRCKWLVNNKNELNLRCVVHTGDVVNWGNVDESQFIIASEAMKVFETAKIPVIYAIGNHDTAAVGVGGGAAVPSETIRRVRDTSVFNKYFSTQRYDYLVTKDDGVIDNSYYCFEEAGAKWMILSLELWPRTEVINWAKSVVETHPKHNIIIVTHSYLNSNGSILTNNGGYGANSPQYVYDNLISQYSNIKFVFCGHTGNALAVPKVCENGNKIVAVLGTFHSNLKNPVRIFNVDVANGSVYGTIYCPLDDEEWSQYRFNINGLSFIAE